MVGNFEEINMANVKASVHIYDDDKIVAKESNGTRWIWIDDFAIFASDEKMRELRAAIDVYLSHPDVEEVGE